VPETGTASETLEGSFSSLPLLALATGSAMGHLHEEDFGKDGLL